jgi:hypothetical protein
MKNKFIDFIAPHLETGCYHVIAGNLPLTACFSLIGHSHPAQVCIHAEPRQGKLL